MFVLKGTLINVFRHRKARQKTARNMAVIVVFRCCMKTRSRTAKSALIWLS